MNIRPVSNLNFKAVYMSDEAAKNPYIANIKPVLEKIVRKSDSEWERDVFVSSPYNSSEMTGSKFGKSSNMGYRDVVKVEVYKPVIKPFREKGKGLEHQKESEMFIKLSRYGKHQMLQPIPNAKYKAKD